MIHRVQIYKILGLLIIHGLYCMKTQHSMYIVYYMEIQYNKETVWSPNIPITTGSPNIPRILYGVLGYYLKF